MHRTADGYVMEMDGWRIEAPTPEAAEELSHQPPSGSEVAAVRWMGGTLTRTPDGWRLAVTGSDGVEVETRGQSLSSVIMCCMMHRR